MKFNLDKYLPYLIHRVGPNVERQFFEAMKSLGVTVEEWRVIAAIYALGPQSLGDLAVHTSINNSTLSRLVGRLIKGEVVSRRRVVNNNRAVEISLRTKGIAIAEEMIPHCLQYERNICAHLTKTEIAQLRTLLPKLYDVISGATYDPTSLDPEFAARQR